MHPNALRYHLLLHAVVIVWGATGLLGKLVEAPSPLMVWYRVLIAVVSIAVYCVAAGVAFRLRVNFGRQILATGLLVGLHWVFFFESVKQSTVSVTMVCLATGPFFVALMGAVVNRRRVHLHEVLLGLMSTVGVAFVFHFEMHYARGILLGVAAALLSASFFVLNSTFLQRGADSTRITLYEMLGALAGLTVYGLAHQGLELEAWRVSWSDLAYLVFLGVVCTAFAFIAGVYVMRALSPFTTMMTVNLEPIYGIALALLVLGEDEFMSPGFYLGAGIVLAGILANSLIKKRHGLV